MLEIYVAPLMARFWTSIYSLSGGGFRSSCKDVHKRALFPNFFARIIVARILISLTYIVNYWFVYESMLYLTLQVCKYVKRAEL